MWEYASAARERCAEELSKLMQMQKMWALRKPSLNAHISALQKKIKSLEQEVDEIIMERIRKKE